jgi:hypothetical protein
VAKDQKFKALLAGPKFAGSTSATAMVKWLMSDSNLMAG